MNTKRAFRDAILAVTNCPGNASDAEIDTLDKQFRDAFLLFGSQTDDNVSCTENVQVGFVDDGTSKRRPVVGLRLAKNHRSLSTVLNSAEGCPVPAQLLADCPDMTQAQWDAVLRMATMLILALEGEPTAEAN
jgi:hypothetical protein